MRLRAHVRPGCRIRYEAPAESRVATLKIRKLPERLCTSPSYAAYNESSYNYDTMSFARVKLQMDESRSDSSLVRQSRVVREAHEPMV